MYKHCAWLCFEAKINNSVAMLLGLKPMKLLERVCLNVCGCRGVCVCVCVCVCVRAGASCGGVTRMRLPFPPLSYLKQLAKMGFRTSNFIHSALVCEISLGPSISQNADCIVERFRGRWQYGWSIGGERFVKRRLPLLATLVHIWWLVLGLLWQCGIGTRV